MEITILDIFKCIALGALAMFLLALSVFLIKLVGAIKELKETLAENRKNINKTIDEVPAIMKNVVGITDKADRLVGDVSPDVRNITHSVSGTLNNVEAASNNVSDTVEYVSESVADVATNFKYGITGPTEITSIASEVFNFVRMVLKR